MLLRAVFYVFMVKNQIFNFFYIACRVRTKKLLDTEVNFFLNWEVHSLLAHTIYTIEEIKAPQLC
jgi:hypothetical protein